MVAKNGDFVSALSVWLIANADEKDGKTTKEMMDQFGVSKATISRVLKHPGFERSLRPFYPPAYWFDPTAAPKLMDSLTKENKALERVLSAKQGRTPQWLGQDYEETLTKFRALAPNQRQDVANNLAAKIGDAVRSWNNTTASIRSAVEDRRRPEFSLEWLANLKSMVLVLNAMIDYLESDPRRGTEEEWSIFLTNLEE